MYRHEDVVNAMLMIKYAIERIIRTNDFLSLINTWFVINPDLRFYFNGFKLRVEDYEAYKKVIEEGIVKLDY